MGEGDHMKVGDLVVLKKGFQMNTKMFGVGIIQDENPSYYFIYWSRYGKGTYATHKDQVRLVSESR